MQPDSHETFGDNCLKVTQKKHNKWESINHIQSLRLARIPMRPYALIGVDLEPGAHVCIIRNRENKRCFRSDRLARQNHAKFVV